MRKATELSLALALSTAACGEGALAPTESVVPQATVTNGRADGSVTTPFEMHGVLEWIVDQSPGAQAQCAPRPGIAVGSGSGNATMLGDFHVVKSDHCSVDLASTPPLVDGVGKWEWAASDGSTLYGTYEFLFLPPPLGFYSAIIEGGTGRLARATGAFALDPDRTTISCVDALCLYGATFDTVAHGWLTVPRP